jgi:hypothetical protein
MGSTLGIEFFLSSAGLWIIVDRQGMNRSALARVLSRKRLEEDIYKVLWHYAENKLMINAMRCVNHAKL